MRTKFTGLLIFLLFGPTFAQSFTPQGWLEDFEQLKHEMSSHYANLEWAVAERGIDLKRLSADTAAKIREAKSDAEARIAIDNFLRAFGDGHLRAEWTTSPTSAAVQADSGTICQRLGYRSRPLRQGIDLTPLAGFKAIDSAESRIIPSGSGILPNGKRFGLVSIRLFDDSVFPELCEAAVSEMKLAADSQCDEGCEERVRSSTSNRYVAALTAQVERLNKEKIDVLLVDLTGNGGGNDVYQPMARTLTAVPLRSPNAGFVRHPHWAKQNREKLADLEAEIQKASGEMRRKLKLAAEAARRDLAEAEKPCDLSPLWENRKANCSLVVAFAKSPVPYAKPGELSNTALGNIYFSASRYEYREGVFRGKLVVLVDPRTASSSEAFAAMLRDNNAARVIGYPTLGAGCGYTNGGVPATLKKSGARVRMPDCVRLRADGANEINGVTPDVFVPWRQNDSEYQRARRVVDTLNIVTKSF